MFDIDYCYCFAFYQMVQLHDVASESLRVEIPVYIYPKHLYLHVNRAEVSERVH